MDGEIQCINLLPEVRVRYLSGDEVVSSAWTINDVRVDLANRHDCFANDITVISLETGLELADEDAVAPSAVNVVVLSNTQHDIRHWKAALRAHAKARDPVGTQRAMQRISDSGEMSCEDVLLDWLRDGTATIDAIRMLLQCGVSVDCETRDHVTPLFYACYRGDMREVDVLLSAGADVNHRSAWGDTCIFSAVQKGHRDAVRMLVNARADVNHCNNEQETPLALAVEHGHIQVAQILLTAGANANYEDMWRDTVLFTATKSARSDLVQMLLTHDADINHENDDKETALFYAARLGCTDIVHLLTAAGANARHMNDALDTPLDIARRFLQQDVTQVLSNHLAT